MSNPETRDLSFVLDDPYYGRIAPDMDDIVMRYASAQYDHIRYHAPVQVQTEEGIHVFIRMRALFVGGNVLDLLAKYGVPEAYADKPTSTVVSAYEADQIERFEAEMDNEETQEG